MVQDLIKAQMNLFAVFKNFEDLVKYDAEMAALVKGKNISIQFGVSGGLKAWIAFKNGVCTVGQGKYRNPSIKLYLSSPQKLNLMMEGKANPLPLKGITKIGFLTKEFGALSKRLEYYLTPTEEKLKDKAYLEINTRMTLTTAAFSLQAICDLDPIGVEVAHHISDGALVIKVLPNEPAVTIQFKNHHVIPSKGAGASPRALIEMKDLRVANDFLNGRSDAFTEIALSNVTIRGLIPMIESVSLLLDRIPLYLK